MNLASQYALAGVGVLLLVFCVRGRVLRTRLGISLVVLGFGVIFVLPSFIGNIDVGIFAVAMVLAGSSMFYNRREHEE